MTSLQVSKFDDLRVSTSSIVAAIVAALAMSFAAGAASVSAVSRTGMDATHSTPAAPSHMRVAARAADTMPDSPIFPNASITAAGPTDFGPFEYFPDHYKNEATEVEPLPPQS